MAVKPIFWNLLLPPYIMRSFSTILCQQPNIWLEVLWDEKQLHVLPVGLRRTAPFKHNVTVLMNKDTAIPVLRETPIDFQWKCIIGPVLGEGRQLNNRRHILTCGGRELINHLVNPVIFCLVGSLVTWVIDSSYSIRTGLWQLRLASPNHTAASAAGTRRRAGHRRVFVINNDEVLRAPLLLHL